MKKNLKSASGDISAKTGFHHIFNDFNDFQHLKCNVFLKQINYHVKLKYRNTFKITVFHHFSSIFIPKIDEKKFEIGVRGHTRRSGLNAGK